MNKNFAAFRLTIILLLFPSCLNRLGFADNSHVQASGAKENILAMDTLMSNSRTFTKGDRWCAIGDSITHAGDYHKYIYLYYLTRFPKERFEFINCGSGGDTAAGVLRRLDPDILVHKPTVATIMLGINDIWWENNKSIGPNDYIRDMGILVDRLKAQNCRVIVITPSPYDSTVKSNAAHDPKREGLDRYVRQLRMLAEKKDVPIVDFFKTMTDLTAQRQIMNPAFTLLSPDRVHPMEPGYLVMAYEFLKYQDVPALVSKVNLNAGQQRLVDTNNCQVTELKFNKESISFSLLENALPFPVNDLAASSLALVPFVQELDQEIFQVNGLNQGQYELCIDDTHVGYYSAEELATGVNLATVPSTPQNKQAQRVAKLNNLRHHIFADKLRFIAVMEYIELEKQYPLDDVAAVQADINQVIQKAPNKQAADAIRKQYERYNYLAIKKAQSQLLKEAQAYDDQIYAMNKPLCHAYLLRKSKAKL